MVRRIVTAVMDPVVVDPAAETDPAAVVAPVAMATAARSGRRGGAVVPHG